MSRLTDLIAQAKAKDAEFGRELEREFKVLSARRSFGLNFERHRPESVELPGRPVRKGDKVRVLPPRGETKKGDQRLWKVLGFERKDGMRLARLELIGAADPQNTSVAVEDLIVVAEFRDYIYPGLVTTGKAERGRDKPFHTVINGENFHVLEALTFTHRGKIDAIYIDPPYNSGAKDWKYNNDYVEADDLYRHSKWLAFMERRLKIARELLKPSRSVLIVTIDEKEFLRLGVLIEQTFPEAKVQMITTVISPSGAARNREFTRVNEFIFVAMIGDAAPIKTPDDMLFTDKKTDTQNRSPIWNALRRLGAGPRREDSPSKFYPVLVDSKTGRVVGSDAPLPKGHTRGDYASAEGIDAVWPTLTDGNDGRWELKRQSFEERLRDGHIRANKTSDGWSIQYLRNAQIERLASGEILSNGVNKLGYQDLDYNPEMKRALYAKTVWNKASHDARTYGSWILRELVPGRKFPFPKALYAVEDVLRFFVQENPNAVVLDFFSGSGTTSHAVMRLNRQDDGRRCCISITNNEVAAEEQALLRKQGLRPGDIEWEKWGICDYITKPRIQAAITGKTPEGKVIRGDYKFTDEFPMAEGFEENAEFFTLTYETPVTVSHNRAFARIAPLLWMRAGSEGKRIDAVPADGWEVADTYGLLTDLDKAAPFCKAVEATDSIRIAYIVTDDERRFQSVTRQLPDAVEPVRLYESYLTNFRFSMGR